MSSINVLGEGSPPPNIEDWEKLLSDVQTNVSHLLQDLIACVQHWLDTDDSLRGTGIDRVRAAYVRGTARHLERKLRQVERVATKHCHRLVHTIYLDLLDSLRRRKAVEWPGGLDATAIRYLEDVKARLPMRREPTNEPEPALPSITSEPPSIEEPCPDAPTSPCEDVDLVAQLRHEHHSMSASLLELLLRNPGPVTFALIEQEVYGRRETADSTIRKAVSRLNEWLDKNKSRYRFTVENGTVCRDL